MENHFKTLQEKGILRLGDLLDENNDFIIKSKLRELNISPLEAFRLMSVIDAPPLEWRGKLKTSACGIWNEAFVIQDQCKLILNSEIVWQAVTAKSPSSFESWSNRLLILASRKSSMVRLEKVWANLVKRWLSLVWEASVLASEFSISC